MSKFKTLCASLLLLAAPALAGAAESPGLRITYLVYSGRPNPELTVTDPASLRAIESRLADALAAPAKQGAAAEPVLGYNGILIEHVGGPAAKVQPQPLTIKGREVRIDTAPASDFKAAAATTRVSAAAGDLEAMLLKLGHKRGALDAKTLNVLLDQP
ncbi:hypothetical protein K4L06_01595 [Lysobacter sp. BMK333-48F3]|uniref:hypothetical protein n=1 Tax=Lysobacter sp. BMK333-48F3 TaxID=2867962 RepID=UPI001C8C2FDB|nr:hypothetical protein [Lysobacter sp. BMK333-48F3]MBX9399987.1 hypothetical protein [Lysobacter sp. BMK333-48F3]